IANNNIPTRHTAELIQCHWRTLPSQARRPGQRKLETDIHTYPEIARFVLVVVMVNKAGLITINTSRTATTFNKGEIVTGKDLVEQIIYPQIEGNGVTGAIGCPQMEYLITLVIQRTIVIRIP